MDLNIRREFAAAAFLIVFGTAFSVYATTFLTIGNFAFMGPGMFPLIVGVVISGVGLIHFLITLAVQRHAHRDSEADHSEPIQWRSLAVVIASLSVFSVAVEFFGLFPGIFALTAIASLGNERLTPALTLSIATALSLMAWVIFVRALGLPFTMYDWPF